MAVSGPKKDNGFGCRVAARCSDTQEAWRQGCRHPGAVRAHETWRRNRRGERADALAVYAATGECGAKTHGSRIAYEVAGCRHEEARKAKDRYDLERQAAKKRRDRALAVASHRDSMRAKRMTGGRLRIDPRRPWRSGNMAVGRVSVSLLVAGWKVPEATEMERMVAILRLSRKTVWDRAELTSKQASGYRTLYMSEIAQRIGVSAVTVRRLRDDARANLRDSRTQRRLADSQWRVAVRAAAADDPDRKLRERERHARCAAERERRRTLYAMRRSRADYTYRAALRSVLAMGM